MLSTVIRQQVAPLKETPDDLFAMEQKATTKTALELARDISAARDRAVPTSAMEVAFQQISPRQEQVALTLGCSRSQALFFVVLPEARGGLLTAASLAWARAMGEFGPILIFSGATRMRTEVLPTTIFLELSVGNIEAAVAVSLIMIAAAVLVLVVVRRFGSVGLFGGTV